ncbi:cytochrome c-like domain-containing protein [Melampsora americana]|nr:cytochrome c-like domain-containing protein [Melampsora americana]
MCELGYVYRILKELSMRYTYSSQASHHQLTGHLPRLSSRPISTSSTFQSKAESVLTSRTAAVVSSVFAAGSLTWYTQLYGVPFISEAQAMTAAEHGLHAPSYPWSHKGPFETFDHAAIRRGYQVYREVCSACHSLDRIAWRNLVGVSHTVDEVKAMAAEVEYEDGPDNLASCLRYQRCFSNNFTVAEKPFRQQITWRYSSIGTSLLI